jgi:hypothetical protein
MVSRPFFSACLVVGLLLGLHDPCAFGQNALGQRPLVNQRGTLSGQVNQQQLNQNQPMAVMPINIDGTVTGISQGAILVNDKTNIAWKVTVPNDATIHVTGMATVEYLKTGLTVDFKAEFDDKGAIKDKVSELSLVSATAEAGGITAGGGDVGADVGGKSTKHGPAAKSTTKSAAVKGVPPAGSCHVVGKLNAKNGKYTVQVHGVTHPIDLPLADQTTIKVDLADFSLAAQGDTITVAGMGTRPTLTRGTRGANTAPGMVQATDVKIEMAEQLTGTKKKPSTSKSGAPHAKKDKEDGAPPAAN